jgi:hypothetical protein
MQTKALKIVQKIVAAGDPGEKVVHLGGALFAGRIKFVAHPRSLAAECAAGKAEK